MLTLKVICLKDIYVCEYYINPDSMDIEPTAAEEWHEGRNANAALLFMPST